jgi:hypothetical protein
MGLAKEEQGQAHLRGYWEPTGVVCGQHFTTEHLRQLVREFAYEDHCDYCDRTGEAIASDLYVVLEDIAGAFFSYWNTPNEEGLPYESREGGFQGNLEVIQDILDWEFRAEVTEDDQLWADISECFIDEEVCRRNYYELNGEEVLRYGWREFTQKIKHQTRYLFLNEPAKAAPWYERIDGVPPTEMLDRLGQLVFDHGLLKVVPAGERWYRARVHRSSELRGTAEDLGSVPRDRALVANRMSPAGIPMFYGARDALTAIAETWTPGTRGRIATTGAFVAARPMYLVDLTDLPSIPGILEVKRRTERQELSFLYDFVAELSMPILKDEREHIDYVPTQVVTEYFRRIFEDPLGDRVDGLLFRSSRNADGVCCVLFVEHEGCTTAVPGWESNDHFALGLDTTSIELHMGVGTTLGRMKVRQRSKRRR